MVKTTLAGNSMNVLPLELVVLLNFSFSSGDLGYFFVKGVVVRG